MCDILAMTKARMAGHHVVKAWHQAGKMCSTALDASQLLDQSHNEATLVSHCEGDASHDAALAPNSWQLGHPVLIKLQAWGLPKTGKKSKLTTTTISIGCIGCAKNSLIIKLSVRCRILSIHYSKCARKHTHTQMHRGACTHEHSDYTKLNLHSLKWAAETSDGWRQQHRTENMAGFQEKRHEIWVPSEGQWCFLSCDLLAHMRFHSQKIWEGLWLHWLKLLTGASGVLVTSCCLAPVAMKGLMNLLPRNN